MHIRLSSNRILNLADIAEARFILVPAVPSIGTAQLVAELMLLTGGTGRNLATIGAVASEAEALAAALRARPEQFVEVKSGQYFNLHAILSVHLTAMPESDVSVVGAATAASKNKQVLAVRGSWRWCPHSDSAPDAGTFKLTGDAAERLYDALTAHLGEAPDPVRSTTVSDRARGKGSRPQTAKAESPAAAVA
jgi:hypothetical protein